MWCGCVSYADSWYVVKMTMRDSWISSHRDEWTSEEGVDDDVPTSDPTRIDDASSHSRVRSASTRTSDVNEGFYSHA